MAVILASKSPRRQELLRTMGIEDFVIRPAEADERVPENAGPAEIVQTICARKADAARAAAADTDTIIAADTLVFLDGVPLGKPADVQDAKRMLRALSGRAHEVFTGVCLHDAATGCEMVEEVKTAVRFRELTDKEIWDYIHTGEPMDKAGAYGIQGGAGAFVEGLDGSFENVMGFPVDDVERMLRAFTREG